MNLKAYLYEIVNAGIKDWSVISCWGAGAGPSYLNKFTVWNSGQDEFRNLEIDSHAMIASYKKNLSISIAWGLEHNDNFIEEWANGFSNPKATSEYVDFFYNGILVLREIIVSVDGGRCYLPLPKQEIDTGTRTVTRLYVSKEKSEFVRMLNNFSSGRDYDLYLKQSGIDINDGDWD